MTLFLFGFVLACGADPPSDVPAWAISSDTPAQYDYTPACELVRETRTPVVAGRRAKAIRHRARVVPRRYFSRRIAGPGIWAVSESWPTEARK